MAKKLHLSYEKLLAYYVKIVPLRDGFFVPDTYTVARNMTEKQLIMHLYKSAYKQHVTLSHTIFGQYDEKKWFHYLTIASVIQKEAANDQEMAIIASVIYNRLKKKMRLQMDGTLNYGKYSHTKVTPQRIKEDTSSYNTYKHRGLPTHPVCAVKKSAIKAAIFPRKTQYLYFVKGQDGRHIFSENYKQHMHHIQLNRQ